jgi:predicted DNA-binding protein (MmcQ/YjbR family)
MQVYAFNGNKMDLEQLEAFCLQLPFTAMDVKWEHLLCFTLKGKMFCTVSLDEENKISFKVPKETYEEMIQENGIHPAPYLWKNTWVRVDHSGIFKTAEWQAHILTSYKLIKANLLKRDQFDFD